jgi:hypothetical protein
MRIYIPALLGTTLLATAAALFAADEKPKTKGVWTDPTDATLPADFKIQGEYAGTCSKGVPLGCQVIALGNNQFQAVLLPGGLPGNGWDGKHKILLAGSDGTLKPADGKRKYLAGPAEEFSATSTFPPAGQKSATAAVKDNVFKGEIDGAATFALQRVERKSPTLGAKPPEGAIVLFDGTNANEWTKGRVDTAGGILNTDGGDILTKRKFNNYTLHLEFMLPYRPDARGQGRGNSGLYHVDHYETQVLDSFGLDGKNNECGGIYTKAEPLVNMCLPPLTWQTYDAEFTNSVVENGKKVKNARLTLRHNGVVIHDNLEINGPTGGSRSEPEGTPGPIKLQGHGNPLQYRNIWIVEKP